MRFDFRIQTPGKEPTLEAVLLRSRSWLSHKMEHVYKVSFVDFPTELVVDILLLLDLQSLLRCTQVLNDVIGLICTAR